MQVLGESTRQDGIGFTRRPLGLLVHTYIHTYSQVSILQPVKSKQEKRYKDTKPVKNKEKEVQKVPNVRKCT